MKQEFSCHAHRVWPGAWDLNQRLLARNFNPWQIAIEAQEKPVRYGRGHLGLLQDTVPHSEYIYFSILQKREAATVTEPLPRRQCKCGLVMLWEGLSTSWWFPALHFLWMLGHLPGWVIKSLSKLIIFALFLLTEEANCVPTVITSFISSAQGWRTVTGGTNRPQEEGIILLKPSYPIQTPGPEMAEL